MEVKMLIKEVNLKFKEAEGKRFFYMDVGSEVHGRPSFRLWVSGRLVQEEIKDDQIKHYYLKFPVINAGIVRTEKGTLVLCPAQDTVTYNVLIPCGYRGSSSLEVVDPKTAQVYLYEKYSSPRGNLGVSQGAIIVTPFGSIKFKWERIGRLYGSAPTGITIIYPIGREETIDQVEDVKELSQLLK
jgi:hypothetical protein